MAQRIIGDLQRRLRAFAAGLTGKGITLFARVVTAPRAIWAGIEPIPRQRVYFANHTSNGDFVLIWTVLPGAMRARTRPVAALDYWLTSPLRAFIGRDVFNAVLIDRRPETRTADPVQQMAGALDEGASLILFPEGKRNMEGGGLLPFKSGLFHLATARPEVDLVPVWISNLNEIMPKGEVVPLPLICTLTFGAPLHLAPGEAKEVFLSRASAALWALSGKPAPAPASPVGTVPVTHPEHTAVPDGEGAAASAMGEAPPAHAAARSADVPPVALPPAAAPADAGSSTDAAQIPPASGAGENA